MCTSFCLDHWEAVTSIWVPRYLALNFVMHPNTFRVILQKKVDRSIEHIDLEGVNHRYCGPKEAALYFFLALTT